MAGPIEALLEKLTDNPGLRSIIGQHFFKATPAFFAMGYFSLYLDYLYPKGGTSAPADLLAGYIRRIGVDVHCDARVANCRPRSG